MKNLIITISVASALLGCSAPIGLPSSHAGPKLDTLAGTVWLANGLLPVVVAGTVPGAALRAPRLQFLSLTQVGGNGGCNGFGGPVVIKGEVIQIGPLATTRKMCAGTEMGIERQFFADLDKVRKARLLAGHLELLDGAGAVLLRLNRAE
jgi:heat shock protein HslJ